MTGAVKDVETISLSMIRISNRHSPKGSEIWGDLRVVDVNDDLLVVSPFKPYHFSTEGCGGAHQIRRLLSRWEVDVPEWILPLLWYTASRGADAVLFDEEASIVEGLPLFPYWARVSSGV